MNLLVCFPLLICFLPLLIYYSETSQKTNSIYLYSFYNPYFLSISMIGTPCFNIYILRFTAWSQLTLFFNLKFFNRIITFVLSTAEYIPFQVCYYRSKKQTLCLALWLFLKHTKPYVTQKSHNHSFAYLLFLKYPKLFF